MTEHGLRRGIRRLVDEAAPATPWLEDRVMAAIAENAAGPTRGAPRLPSLRLRTATVAAALVAILAVGVLLGSRIGIAPAPAPASRLVPSSDRTILQYRAVLDRDMKAVYFSFRGGGCTTREQCIALTMRGRAATEALLGDLASTPAPPPVAVAAYKVQIAARRYLDQLDAALAAMRFPDSDFIAISNGPTLSDLDLAVAIVDCWPVVPFVRGDLEAGYGCSPEPSMSADH